MLIHLLSTADRCLPAAAAPNFSKMSPNPLRTRRPETPASSSEGRAMELGPQSQPAAALPTWLALFSVLPHFRGVHPEHTVCGSVPQPGHREGGFMSPRRRPLLLRSHCPRCPWGLHVNPDRPREVGVVREKQQPPGGGSVGQSVAILHRGCRFDPSLGHIPEANDE